ncbi:hypothetical protein VDG1235_4573 [Verrucomicrobiia bacterium DG1235]|nr:hypothetical protein VDG1235_4573 [Verrucomicrobiae bacterium DG1235]
MDTAKFSDARCAVFFNCNDPQLPQVSWLVESLRSKTGGDFSGQIFALSTGLSDVSRKWLDGLGVGWRVRDLQGLGDWSEWCGAANTVHNEMRYARDRRGESDIWNGSLCEQLSGLGCSQISDMLASAVEGSSSTDGPSNWSQFRNKRFSKLGIIPALEELEGQFDWVVFCDTDIIFQESLSGLFESLPEGKVAGELEMGRIRPGSGIAIKDGYLREIRPEEASRIEFPDRELNIGLLAARPANMLSTWKAARELMLATENRPLYERHWHEQDFFRLLRAREPERFSRLPSNSVFHACGHAVDFVEQDEEVRFSVRGSRRRPAAMHFAGGTWRKFPMVSQVYTATYETLMQQAGLIISSDAIAYAKAFTLENESVLENWILQESGLEGSVRVAEIGAFFGSLGAALSLRSESIDGLELKVDIVDGCRIGKDWEWQVCRGNRYPFALIPEYGRSQQAIMEKRLGELPGVRLFLGSESAAYEPEEELSLVVFGRAKHRELFKEDVDLHWCKIRAGGWMVVRRFAGVSPGTRLSIMESLPDASEIAFLRYSQAGGFLAVKKAT